MSESMLLVDPLAALFRPALTGLPPLLLETNHVEVTPLPPLAHWMYFLPLHRQSEIGPDGHPKRGGFLPPVPLLPGQVMTAEDAVRRTEESLRALGAGSDCVVSRFVREIPMGYPVPTLGRDDIVRTVDEGLRAHGLYSRGRFGGWRYESSNQDYGYMQGREAVDNALSGTPEDVYWHPDRF